MKKTLIILFVFLFGFCFSSDYTKPEKKRVENSISSDTQILSLSDAVPAGWMLEYMIATETAGNTGTLDLGTTAGGSDVFSQQAFTASTTTTVIINKVFSLTADKALYLNDDGVGTWNSASLNCIFIIKKIQ